VVGLLRGARQYADQFDLNAIVALGADASSAFNGIERGFDARISTWRHRLVFLKIAISFACLILTVAVPVLEVNETHLFNPAWPGHARLHEAWQLIANGAIALVCLYLAWWTERGRLAAVVLLAVTGSFLAAFALGDLYGGSMAGTSSAATEVGGVNPAVLVMAVATVLLMCGLAVQSRSHGR
jgi:hypothetical protein